jgi:hypothetical protein
MKLYQSYLACMVGTDHAGEAQKKHTLKIMQALRPNND